MTPIIFIPGIEATNLVNTNSFGFDIIWNAYDTLGTSIGTSVGGQHIDEMLQYNPVYDEKVASIVNRSNVARFPYEQTIQNLMTKLNTGKTVPDPVYLFGYDWRLSNYENAKRLANFISYLQQKLQGQNVSNFHFLTHSMGALVFRAYLTLITNYDIINKVIMCAPPFLGSPYALIHMVKGDGGIKGFLNKIFGNNDDIRKVVRTYPAIFELLPYYKDAILYTDDNSPVDLTNINDWQSNIYDDIVELFKYRLAALKNFTGSQQQNISTLPVEVRQRMVIVAGVQDNDTLVNVKVDRSGGGVDNFVRLDLLQQGMASGDGTVPEVSSTIYSQSVRTITVAKQNFLTQLNDNLDFHGLFLRDSRVQNIIYRYFMSPDYAANITNGVLTQLTVNADIWNSIGDSTTNISPF